MGEVTADNFEALLPEIEKDIRECSYIALDAEFTGLHPADGRWGLHPPGDGHDLQRYSFRSPCRVSGEMIIMTP